MSATPAGKIGYGRQSISAEDLRVVASVLRGDLLTCGPAIEAFEAAVCGISGAPHAVAVANGTSALRLLYQVAGIGPGTRVGVPALTFIATASQALLLGAEVVLLDVDPETLLLTPEILTACRERLDVVVPVHFAGRLCDMTGIAAIARSRGIRVLEDCAHAFGSSWSAGGRCGDCRQSAGGIFSFHPVKNITTGEGGAVVVPDADQAARLRQLRHHGIVREGFRGDLATRDGTAPWYHEFHLPAGNDRLSDIHAALGVSQCRRLDLFRTRRQALLDRYRRRLAAIDWIHLPPPAPGQRPCWHLCAARIDWDRLGRDRRWLWDRLRETGITPQVHYLPLHHQPMLSRAVRASDLSGADLAYAGLISLPLYPDLGIAGVDRVCKVLRELGRSALAPATPRQPGPLRRARSPGSAPAARSRR